MNSPFNKIRASVFAAVFAGVSASSALAQVNQPSSNRAPSAGDAVQDVVPGERQALRGIEPCPTSCPLDLDVENRNAEFVARLNGVAVPQAGASGCGSCASAGAGVAEMMRVQDVRRVMRSRLTHAGSLGSRMYLSWDYVLNRREVQWGANRQRFYNLIDPNTGLNDGWSKTEPGTATPPNTFQSDTPYGYQRSDGTPPKSMYTLVETTATHASVRAADGTVLRFEATGSYNGVMQRCRLKSITDRKGNILLFTHVIAATPASSQTVDVMKWQDVTDPYGRTATFAYTTLAGMPVLSQIAFPGGRNLDFTYNTTANPAFCHTVVNGAFTSTWEWNPAYGPDGDEGGSATWSEPGLPAEQSSGSMLFRTGYGIGAVNRMFRADLTEVYSRTDILNSGLNLYTSTIVRRGRQFQMEHRSLVPVLRFRRMVDGAWDAWTDVASTAAPGTPLFQFATGVTAPAVGAQAQRTWSVTRSSTNGRVLTRTYPDTTTEVFTYNGFGDILTHKNRRNVNESRTYDAKGNCLTRTVAVGTAVQATESWTWNARGQMTSHTDFNGNVTTYNINATTKELESIVLPSGPGQPAGTVTILRNNATGAVEGSISAAGHQVDILTDELGRTTRIDYEDGTYEQWNYTGAFLNHHLDRNGHKTSRGYDPAGRLANSFVQPKLVDMMMGLGAAQSTTIYNYNSATGDLESVQNDANTTSFVTGDRCEEKSRTVYPDGIMMPGLTSSTERNQYHTTKQTDPFGRDTDFGNHDLDDRAREIGREIIPDGPVVTEALTFDANGNVTSRTDPEGVVTTYVIDERDRVKSVTTAGAPAGQQSESFSYDGNGNRLTHTDRRGKVWTTTWTSRNQVRTRSDPLGNTTTYAYYADGLPDTVTDPDGRETKNYYDDNCCGASSGGRLTRVRDNAGNFTHFEYDPNGNRIKVKDPANREVATEFDALGRVTRVRVDPTGLNLITTTQYIIPAFGAGSETITTNPAGYEVRTVLDGAGRLKQVFDSGDAMNPVVTYAYAMDGGYLKTSVTDANANTTHTFTDGLGRTVRTIDGRGKQTELHYYDNGNLELVIDRDLRRTRHEYDALNRRFRTTQNEGMGGINAVTTLVFDGQGGIDTMTDAEGKVTKYVRDDAGRETGATFAFGTASAKTWSKEYWPSGRLKKFTKPSGTVIDYEFDTAGRLWKRKYNTAPAKEDVFLYHANGLLALATGGLYNTLVDRSNLAADYDMANRLRKERQDAGSGVAREVAWTYTPDGLVDELTHPDATVVKNTYTARRRLNEVKVNGTTVAGHTYDAGGRRQTRTRGNGVTTTWSHDAADRISGINHAGVQQYTYGWTDAGDPMYREDNTTPTRSESWSYDGMHRVAEARVGTLAGNTVPFADYRQAWTLDKAGNWSQLDTSWVFNYEACATWETRTHGDHHELTARNNVGANPTAFDANLNLTDDGANWTFEYDAEDRVHVVRNRATAAIKAIYSYDALGRRVKKIISGAADVYHWYSGQRIVEERWIGTGAVSGRWYYGEYVDEPVAFDNVVVGSRYWYHQDHLFNVIALTNGAAAVMERYDYTTYGATTTYDDLWANPQTTSRVGNPFAYTGREWDVETGLYHYRARTYHPVLGRFNQRDPLGYVDGPGLYEYVGGRATSAVDPFGLDTTSAPRGTAREDEPLGADAVAQNFKPYSGPSDPVPDDITAPEGSGDCAFQATGSPPERVPEGGMILKKELTVGMLPDAMKELAEKKDRPHAYNRVTFGGHGLGDGVGVSFVGETGVGPERRVRESEFVGYGIRDVSTGKSRWADGTDDVAKYVQSLLVCKKAGCGFKGYVRMCSCGYRWNHDEFFRDLKSVAKKFGVKVCACHGGAASSQSRYCVCYGKWVCADP